MRCWGHSVRGHLNSKRKLLWVRFFGTRYEQRPRIGARNARNENVDHGNQADSVIEGLQETLTKLAKVGDYMDCSDDYVRLLRQCCGKRAISEGRRVHMQISKHGYGGDSYLGNLIVQMYIKCGSLQEARIAFDAMRRRNVFTWNFMISAYAKNGHDREALDLYLKMDISPNAFIFASALAACASLGALEEGKAIHGRVKSSGCEHDVVVQNALVTMYARCGSLGEGRKLFDSMPQRNLVSWNAMISAYVQCDHPKEALDLYRRMKSERLEPNSFIFASVLTACASLGALENGTSIHQHIVAVGLRPDIVVQNALVNMYAKCGSLDDARMVFNQMQRRDVYTWTAIITGYAQHGHGKEAFELYKRMSRESVQPNAATFASLIAACSTLEDGRQIHAQIVARGLHSDVVVETALMVMYARCGSLDDARCLFDKIQQRDVVSWSAMVAAYEQQGQPAKAIRLYREMISEGVDPNPLTFCSILQACTTTRNLEEGKAIHERIIGTGLDGENSVQVALVNMYCKCGSLEEARKTFEVMEERDVVTWTAMITGHVQQGQGREALELYQRMKSEGVEPDSITFAAIVSACAIIGALDEGKAILAHISPGESRSMLVGTALVNMYAKCGCLEDARRVFDEMHERDVVVWTVLIRGYTHRGYYSEALDLYYRMVLEGVEPTYITYASIIPACATHQTFAEGKAIHRRIVASGLEMHPVIDAALVSMYCKCGTEQDVRGVFDKMPHRSVVTWNALIAAYNRHWRSEEALELYREMGSEGVEANAVTFTVALSACSHLRALETGREIHSRATASGMLPDFVQNALISMYAKCDYLEDARRVFESMKEKNVVACTAIIAAYAQHGYDREALELYKGMNFEPDEITFTSALAACSSLGDLEEGKAVHARIVAAMEGIPSDFVGTALITMYAKCGSMVDARKVFDRMARTDRVSWSAMMTAYAQHGHYTEVLELYRLMATEGVEPDGVTFISILISCSQAGLLEDAWQYFVSMSTDHGIQRMQDHYQCMIDLLGRSGRLDEAEELISKMDCQPDAVTWKTLLSACKDHEDVERGARAATHVFELLPGDSAPYILLSHIYASKDNEEVMDRMSTHQQMLELESHQEMDVELERLVDRRIPTLMRKD